MDFSCKDRIMWPWVHYLCPPIYMAKDKNIHHDLMGREYRGLSSISPLTQLFIKGVYIFYGGEKNNPVSPFPED